MKAIETEYKGYKFRSRLEARWAVFFDACGVKWEYEPEGFDLGDGVYYLPDFLLHNVHDRNGKGAPFDLYVEVKGQMTAEDAKKIRKFYEAGCSQSGYIELSKNAILVVGNIPNLDDMFDTSYDEQYGVYFYNFATIDGDCFGAFPGVDYDGKFVLFGHEGNYTCDMDEGATEDAYCLARQARFEHGETPLQRRPRPKYYDYDCIDRSTPIAYVDSGWFIKNIPPHAIDMPILEKKETSEKFIPSGVLLAAFCGNAITPQSSFHFHKTYKACSSLNIKLRRIKIPCDEAIFLAWTASDGLKVVDWICETETNEKEKTSFEHTRSYIAKKILEKAQEALGTKRFNELNEQLFGRNSSC